MAQKPKASTAQTEFAPSDDMLLEALNEVKQELRSTQMQLRQLSETFANRTAQHVVGAPATEAPLINSWEDDPFSEAVPSPNPSSGAPTAVTMPVNSNQRLRTVIVDSQPVPARYTPGTPGFQYWIAAEALARGINFWGELLPAGTTWSASNPMRVRLVEAGQQLNANYSRANGLRFYQQSVAGREVFSCESPDVVCHELGHAILDALRPQLFHVASTEAGAFHEAFGDMTAILCALQLPQMRSRVITETGGRLNRSSRLSRIAEQLGWGIRQLSPTAVDRDCLRNAANRFFYKRPDLLPPSAPANLLSSAVHSFSRVFTGAFLDALARMFRAMGSPEESSLAAVARDMGQLLVDGVHAAPVTTAYFSQVASAMVRADEVRFGGRYRSALTRAFVERGILSVSSSMALAAGPQLTSTEVTPTMVDIIESHAGSPMVLRYADEPPDESFRQGLGDTSELPRKAMLLGNGLSIEVHAPEGRPRFAATPALFGAPPDDILDDDGETRTFVEGLIYRGEVSLGPTLPSGAIASVTSFMPDTRDVDLSRVTHSLVAEDGKVVLRRNHFSCGCCGGEKLGTVPICR